MCNGFGGFYSKEGKVYFTAPDEYGHFHHGRTAEAMGEVQDVVPFEVSEWTAKSFEWHDCDVPDWITGKDKKAVLAVMRKVKPIVKKYLKVEATAWAEYLKAQATALEDYLKAKVTAWAEMVEALKQVEGYVEE